MYLGVRREMINIETQYFSFNRILLLTVGLWPYQQTKLIRLRIIFFFSILTTAIFFQFTTFLTSKCTLNLVIKVLSTTSFFTIFAIKYICFALNTEAMKDLLTQLQHVYDEIKDENENAIVNNYSCYANRYTIGLTILAVCSISAFIIVQCWSGILDIISPINVSRPHYLPIMTNYFINPERYFYLIVLHTNTAFCTGAIAMVAIGTMLMAYLQHTSGMFKISSYRIECAVKSNILRSITLKNENLVFERIICAVNMHRQAMKLSELLVSKFEVMLFCLIMIGVISLSINLFRIFQIASFGEDFKEFLMPCLFVAISILYMFLANNAGQDVMNHNNHVFATAYDVPWYTTSLYVQNLILFLLQRGAKDFTLSVGGLFIGSLECFASLVKASVSYFTVIYSTRSKG